MLPHNGKQNHVNGPPKAAAPDSDVKAIFSPLYRNLTTEQRKAIYHTTVMRSNNVVQLRSADRRILYSSRSTKHVVGYSPTKILGLDWRTLVHPDDLAIFDDYWRRTLDRPGRMQTAEYRIRHHNGQWVWLDGSAINQLDVPKVEAVVVNFRNVDKRKIVEDELKAAEARWRFMAESLPELIFTIRPDGSFEYCNPQWQSYSGVPVKSFLEDTEARYSIMHPDDLKSFLETWRLAYKHGKQSEYQVRLRRRDGIYRWHICRILPMKGPDGNIQLWVGSCTDIDDLQLAMKNQHELELQAATLKVRQRELLAINQQKDEFISLASHQLRTPATGVKQYLGMLLQGFAGPLNEDQQAFLQTAYESNERQISIVNDLLQVARIDAGKVKLTPRKTNIIKLIKSVVNEHTGQITGREQRLMLKVPKEPVKAKVDSDRFCMVLDNILDNASKYTPSDKTISVAVDQDEDAGQVQISVTDQGIGMSNSDIDKIFNKFSRLENPLTKSVDGSGLGLYWAKKIVELHHGTITVKSRVGKGTTFIISLPA